MSNEHDKNGSGHENPKEPPRPKDDRPHGPKEPPRPPAHRPVA